MLREWRKKNPELVRAQKRYYESKVSPRVPTILQRKEKDNNIMILMKFFGGLFGVYVVLTDLR